MIAVKQASSTTAASGTDPSIMHITLKKRKNGMPVACRLAQSPTFATKTPLKRNGTKLAGGKKPDVLNGAKQSPCFHLFVYILGTRCRILAREGKERGQLSRS